METSHLNVFPRLGLNIRKARFLFLPSVLPSFLPLSLSLFPRPCSTLVGHDSSNLTLANDGKGGRCYPLLSDTVATKSICRYSYPPMKNLVKFYNSFSSNCIKFFFYKRTKNLINLRGIENLSKTLRKIQTLIKYRSSKIPLFRFIQCIKLNCF